MCVLPLLVIPFVCRQVFVCDDLRRIQWYFDAIFLRSSGHARLVN